MTAEAWQKLYEQEVDRCDHYMAECDHLHKQIEGLNTAVRMLNGRLNQAEK